jgi:hypothetical protein
MGRFTSPPGSRNINVEGWRINVDPWGINVDSSNILRVIEAFFSSWRKGCLQCPPGSGA